MYNEPIHIVDGSIYAYLLIDYKTAEILDANILARTYYKTTNKFPTLESLFTSEADHGSITEILGKLEKENSVVLEDIVSLKANGENFNCHIEICKISNELLFLVIKENSKTKDSQIKELVRLTDNPIFVLEHDDNFKVAYGNSRFYHYIVIDDDYKGDIDNVLFIDLLAKEKRKKFIQDVNYQLESSGECDVDVELNLDSEYSQLFRFNAYKSLIDGRLYGVLISAKKQIELMKKIEYDQQYFDIMQKFSKDLLFRIDVKNRTLVHRGDISKFVGMQPEMDNFPECMRDNGLIHPEDIEGYISFCYKLMSGVEASFEPRFQFTNGTYDKYKLQGSPLFDENGNTVQIVGKSENIQKFIDIEAKANYDALTTTLNKQSFKELIEEALHRSVESDRFAILFLDFDNFKSVNDTLGHAYGDFLLEAMGKRILNCVRKQDRVGRVGGDEFIIFFKFAPTPESVLERAEAILYSLRREFNKDNVTYKSKASIGIALFPEHGETYEELYQKADKALYKSKARGKDVSTIYSDDLE